MQEDDPLAQGYDFEKITVESFKEEARRQSVSGLIHAISRSEVKGYKPTGDISEIMSGISALNHDINYDIRDISITEHYDTFTAASGTEVESRIVQITTGGKHSVFEEKYYSFGGQLERQARLRDASDKILLLVATATGQEGFTKSNVRYGAIQRADGLTEFFKIAPLDELDESELPSMISIAITTGGLDGDSLKTLLLAAKITPIEEQALIGEFARATKALTAAAEAKEAAAPAVPRLDRPIKPFIKLNLPDIGEGTVAYDLGLGLHTHPETPDTTIDDQEN